MKYWIAFVVLICVIPGILYAADTAELETINNKSVELFITVFPQYQEWVEQHGRNVPLNETIEAVTKKREELEALFAKHGITMSQFAVLSQKITIAFLNAKTKEVTSDDPLFQKISQLTTLSEEDEHVIKNYFPQLQTIFEPSETTEPVAAEEK